MSNDVKKLRVEGRVQGVFYRASTRDKARELSLEGYAKNLSDGAVEVLISGDCKNIEALITWLWQGPPASKVTDVIEQSVLNSEVENISGFTTS